METSNQLLENQVNSEERQLTYSVQDISKILGISKSKAYKLCDENLFKVKKIGRIIRISRESFHNWFNL